MSKSKILTRTSEKYAQLAERAGLWLMALAAMTGMLELPNRPNNRIVVPGQPTLALASENSELNNPIRRDKEEESALQYISYRVTQRTHARASKK